MNLYTALVTLVLVMDPLGNIPVFLAILKNYSPKRQSLIIIRESFVAFLILTIFLFFGGRILRGLNITEPALNIAGGIILFIIALKMIFPTPELDKKAREDTHHEEPFIVPLAIPMTAGPSALATVMLFASQQPHKIWLWFLAVFFAFLIFTAILLCSRYLMRLLGQKALIALERLMGMLLTTLAVQMFLSGVSNYFHLLKQV